MEIKKKESVAGAHGIEQTGNTEEWGKKKNLREMTPHSNVRPVR